MKRLHFNRPFFWLALLVATLGISIGMVVYSQQQVQLNDDHVLELSTVVVGPTDSKNIGSQVNIAPGDQVKWIIYTGSPRREPNTTDLADAAKVGYPEKINGTVTLPTGFLIQPNTFYGPPDTTFVQGAGSFDWEQSSTLTTIHSQTPNSVTIRFSVDLQKYFQCDPGRDTLLAWDKIRIDHNIGWGSTGLRDIRVDVMRPNGSAGEYVQLLDSKSKPVVITTTGTNPSSVPTVIDIRTVPSEHRLLRFDITLSSDSTTFKPSDFAGKPIDVTWQGDQPQVCFTAVAPNSLGKIDYTTEVNAKYARQDTKASLASLTTDKRFDPSGTTTYKGYGPAVLTAQLPTSTTEFTPVLLLSLFDMSAHTGDLRAFVTTDSKISGYLGGMANKSSAASSLKLGGDDPNEMQNRPAFTARESFVLADSWSRLPLTWSDVNGDTSLFETQESPSALALRRTFTYLDTTGLYSQYDTKVVSQGVAERRVQYLRGSRTLETSIAPLQPTSGANFRQRQSVLGPVVNSSPVWVPQTPQVGYPESLFPGYSAFRNNDVVNRLAPHVLFGGHDGMLHGFSVTADKLTEAFAFMPTFLFEKAHRFTNGTLAQLGLTPFAIDSTPMVRDVDLSPAAITNSWRTVAVSALGRLNRGIFAVDITTRFDNIKTASGFPYRATLWEYTNLSNAPAKAANDKTINSGELRDLGQMVYQPPINATVGAEQIVQMSNRRWAAVVGNGINSHIGPDPARNGTGRAVLYLFFFGTNDATQKKPADVLWLRIPVSETDQELAYNNGLLSPRPYDIDGDGKVDLVYAGDMKGNLWRFDLRNLDAIKVTKLFTAINGRPILATPAVRPYQDKGVCKVVGACQFVSFGTGHPASPLTPGPVDVGMVANKRNALYGIIDHNATSDAEGVTMGTMTNGKKALIADDGDALQVHELSQEGVSSPTERSITGTSPAPTKKGWKIELWNGEQLSSNPDVSSDNTVLFTTGRYWPFKDSTTYRDKRGWLTQLGLFSGLGAPVLQKADKTTTASFALAGPVYASPSALPSSPSATTEQLVLQLASNGTVSGNTGITLVTRTKPPNLLGRLSWREVYGE